MNSRIPAAIAAAAFTMLAADAAFAHAVCGNRVFPPTLTMDDPGVNDELSLPTIQYTPIPAAGGASSGTQLDYAFEYDKTITEDLGIAFNDDYLRQNGAGASLGGWDNLTLTLKDQLPCSEAHEFMVSVGVVRELAGTGSQRLANAGLIDSVSFTAPTLYLGKGFGDVPVDVLRPLAITGELGYQVSDWPSASPNQWAYAVSLQYSLPYMQQHVKALDVPEFITHLVPIVEFAFSTPEGGPTTGTMAPGIFYEAQSWQAGMEAVIPINAATRATQGTGFIAQFHLFLDDLLPDSLGRPIVKTNLWQ